MTERAWWDDVLLFGSTLDKGLVRKGGGEVKEAVAITVEGDVVIDFEDGDADGCVPALVVAVVVSIVAWVNVGEICLW